MSTNKANIQQIQAYLNGKLDAEAMHALERQAQDDPFLMEAIEGYQNTATDQQANFDDIEARFTQRRERLTKRPITLWRTLAIAATLLIVFSAGLLLLKNKEPKHEQLAVNKTALPPVKAQDSIAPVAAEHADANHITGTITDATGHALAGAKVRIKGTKLSTKTDSAGRFNLASNAKGILTISAPGYDRKLINIADKKARDITLSESSNALATVSVTAYVEDDKPANKTHPTIGWKAFRDYLRKNAFIESGETGLVKLAFTVTADGNINGIRVLNGKTDAMNQKAINLVLNGPEWKGITPGETRLKILFRKPRVG